VTTRTLSGWLALGAVVSRILSAPAHSGDLPRPATVPAGKPAGNSSHGRARCVAELCIHAVADESLIDGWITAGRGRARRAARGQTERAMATARTDGQKAEDRQKCVRN
jgi:hypothetical protein